MLDVSKFGIKAIQWLKSNVISFLVMGTIVLFIWWKHMIGQQADAIVGTSNGNKTAAPRQAVTLAALTRKALSSPSLLLKDAASLGLVHVKWLLAFPIVSVADPNAVHVVLSEKFKCSRTVMNHESKGVLGLNGEKHATAKKQLVRIFKVPKTAQSFVDHLQARLASETFPEMTEAATAKESLDLSPVFEELFVDAIGLWCLGLPTPAENSSKEETERREKIVEAKRCLANLTFVLPSGIAWYFDRLRNWVPYTEYLLLPGSRDYLVRTAAKAKARQTVNLEYVAFAKEFREEGKVRGGFAGVLLKDTLQELEKEELTDLEFEFRVFEQMEAVQIAAHMPLYSLVPHILYLLAHSPSHQKTIHAEVSKLSAKHPITPAQASQQLPYLTNFVLETLRLLPPWVLSYNRSSSENAYRLPGHWHIPRSTNVAVDFLNTLRNRGVFGGSDGNDAATFRPDRFAAEKFEYVPTTEETPAEELARLKKALKEEPVSAIRDAYVPFGAGTFACPAQRLALDLVRVVVAEVVKRYEFAPVKGRESVNAGAIVAGLEEFGCDQGSVLRHVAGCPVLVKKRK